MAKFWRKVRAIRDTLLGTVTNGMNEQDALKAIRNVIIAELAPEIEAAVKDIINSSAMTIAVKENLIDHAEDKLRALFADWADDGKINDSEGVVKKMKTLPKCNCSACGKGLVVSAKEEKTEANVPRYRISAEQCDCGDLKSVPCFDFGELGEVE